MRSERKIALVTGASDGVGKETAKRLGSEGFHVLLHGRDQQKTEAVKAELEHVTGGSFDVLIADFASLADVTRLSELVLETYPRLDLLINNAGIGIEDNVRQESADGYELRFAVNYLAHVSLTEALVDLLKRSAPSRIVNVASAGQAPIDFSDVMLEQSYSGFQAYTQSKAAQIMYSFYLAARLQGTGVSVNALHPATFMNTKMVENPISTVDDGARSILNLAIGAAGQKTGRYFSEMSERRALSQAYEPESRARLFALSDDLITGATRRAA